MAPLAVVKRRLASVCLLVALTGCLDASPTEPMPDAAPDEEPVVSPDPIAGNAVLSSRAHRFTDDGYALLSSASDVRDGRYRYRSAGEALPAVGRDDFILVAGPDESVNVRRVLAASVDGGELAMETGPAYWHEVIRDGTYQLTMPLDGRGDARFQQNSVAFALAADSVRLPPLEATFQDTDVCAWLHEVLALIPGPHDRTICGKEVDMEVAYGVSIGVAGTLDSLRILEGNVRVTGELDLSVTVDAGGISGGRAPAFYPCNLGAYLGCLSTPTGAALIDFLRRYAPAIPEASLPPVRVCVPGTPVRIRAGYWSGWTWNPPVYRQCRVADTGELPTIILPSITATANELRPRVQGDMTIRVKGDGKFTLELPIPGLAAKTGYEVTNDFKAKAEIGIFVLLRTTLKNGAATVRLTFDDTGRLTQSWTDTQGWAQDFELVDKDNHAELLSLDNPDSIVVRVGVPIKANAEVCIAIIACGNTEEEGGDSDFELEIFGKELFQGLNIGAKAGLGVSMFEEFTYTREQIHPEDADVDNWHLSVEAAYDLFAKAGVRIPLTGWILPQVPREKEGEWECCRVGVGDYWGQGKLDVTTATTGVDVDPDGYRILVERADTLPGVMDAGVTRIGNGWPHKTFEEWIDANGAASFGEVGGFLPCIAIYSDAFFVGNPVWGLSLAGARSLGLNIPTYGATSACRWLIGRYRVSVTDVAANCVVVGGAVRDSVWLQQRRFTEPVRDDRKQLHFDVECGVAGAQGGLEVVIPSHGRDRDAPPSLLVNGAVAGVFDTDTVRVNGLAPGNYDVALSGLPALCVSDPQTATVVGGAVTPVAPFVVCAEFEAGPGSVTYAASLAGDDADANGYSVLRDGAPAAHLPVDGEGEVTGVPASVPTVFMVADIAGNCQAEAMNPRVITLDAARTPVDVPFPVTCFAEKPDTLVGTLDASGWPATAVTLRAADGATRGVSGPKTAELARLTGSPVRVWGRASATGISVHGYDLRSQLGDDRWLGVVMERPDGVWLFGEEAIRLVDPPAALVAESGRLVWVMGVESGGGVQPTLYGVIR